MAEALGGVIVNADALQVYGCWRILTARPPIEDENRAKHALYGHIGYEEAYSVGAWLRDVAPLIASGQRLIFVGGTGLYFQALTQGLAHIPAIPPEIRAEGDALLAKEGREAFQTYLAAHDPALFARMDTQNPARLQRGWEVHRATGRPLSMWQNKTGAPLIDPSSCLQILLISDPAWLRQRIDVRLEQMLAEGALEECKALLPHWQPELPASRALGAPDFVSTLLGEQNLEQALRNAKTATHQFAKRQRTWFRSKMADWTQIESETLGDEHTIKELISMG